MTAVATAPKSRAAKPRAQAAPAPAETLPASYASLFAMAAQLLEKAWLTDEPHAFSGESDRLLSIAARLARAAPKNESYEDSQGRAYDIAACINAARLVPGDVESAERSVLIGQVATILGEIAETTPNDILRTNVPRPALPNSPAKPDKLHLEFMHFDALCYLGCALEVLELHVKNEEKAALYGLRDLLRQYYEKADRTADRGQISQDDLDDLSASLEIIRELVFHTLEKSEFDSVVLHAVDYLLRDAKAIADGELYQTKEVGNA